MKIECFLLISGGKTIEYLRSQGIELNFTTSLFQIDNEQAFYRAWKRYCKANDIQPISLYELRHSFVSIAKYLPEGQIKPIVGHSRSMDTFGTYGHKIKGEDEKAAEAIGELFDKIMG